MSTEDIDLTSKSFELGLLVLLAAQILSAFMGVYVQDIYAEHGKHWEQNLFYSHFLSLPFFMPLSSTLHSQYLRLAASPPLFSPDSPFLSSSSSPLPSPLQAVASKMPESVFFLLMNAITQLACISGVNLLSANTSAVTVTIVLNIRKLVSFMFSIWLFGNQMGNQMILGAVLVFGSGALYGWETTVGIKRRQQKLQQQQQQPAGGKKKQ